MWWLAIPPAVALGAYVVKKIFEEDDVNYKLTTPQQSLLECNLKELERIIKNETNHSKIAILGQPGAGKSTLLSIITDNQCTPRPIIGQQTDATKWNTKYFSGFFNTYKSYKFVDAPGYDTIQHPIESYLYYFPFGYFDLIFLLLKDKIHASDEKIFNCMKFKLGSSISRKLILVKSFSDYLSDNDKHEIKEEFDRKFELSDKNIKFLFLSNRYRYGINDIKSIVFSLENCNK